MLLASSNVYFLELLAAPAGEVPSTLLFWRESNHLYSWYLHNDPRPNNLWGNWPTAKGENGKNIYPFSLGWSALSPLCCRSTRGLRTVEPGYCCKWRHATLTRPSQLSGFYDFAGTWHSPTVDLLMSDDQLFRNAGARRKIQL